MLLDLDALAEGHEFFSLGGSSISPDGTLLAYSTDVVGDERYTIRVKDLATGDLLADEITGVIGGATWDRAGEHLYYATVDESWRPDKIWRHRLGTAQAEDELVHHEHRRPVLRRRRAHPHRPVPGRSRPAPRPPPSTASSTPRPPSSASRSSAERREGLEYSLDHAVIGGEDVFLVLHNGTGPDFELGHRARSRPPRRRAGRRWSPTTPPSASRTSTRSPATWSCTSAARG